MAIVGVGMIGGSLGIDLLAKGLADRVIGVGRRPASLRTARARGAVTSTTTNLAVGVADADLVVVCTPVARIVDDVRAAAAVCRPATVITDVGSVKQRIVADLAPLGKSGGLRFVGSHPMAGSERTGPAAAIADLLRGRLVIVTPNDETDTAALGLVKRFWKALGARVVEMRPSEHDRLVAASSHLPHLAAAAIVAATADEALPFAASGFADSTRIAAGDPALWRQILADNRGHVLTALGAYETVLAACRRALETGDDEAMERILAEAKRRRDALGN